MQQVLFGSPVREVSRVAPRSQPARPAVVSPVEEAVADCPVGVRGDLAPVLSELVAQRDAARRAEVAQLRLAARVADLLPGLSPAEIAAREAEGLPQWAIDRPLHLAGPGAPACDPYAPEVVAVALSVRTEVAHQLLADALVLRHRLPGLWRLAQTDPRVAPWQARTVAGYLVGAATSVPTAGGEPVGTLAHIDRAVDTWLCTQLSARPELGTVALLGRCREAHYRVDPDAADAADAVEDAALSRRGVWFDHQESTATSAISGILDTHDAHALDASLADLAGVLGALGDPSPLDHRRATALGVLADPQRALDLHAALAQPDPAATQPPTQPPTRRIASTPPATTLFVHLSAADLATGSLGTASVEGVGAVSLRLLSDWLTRPGCPDQTKGSAVPRIVVRPVLHTAGPATGAAVAVERHDPPPWMAEQVRLRDAHCVFPGCFRDSRACQLDHIDPYLPLDEGGPPGQTSLDGLAPLCLRHHRAKTLFGWSYHRQRDGSYLWRSPHGQTRITRPAARYPLRS